MRLSVVAKRVAPIAAAVLVAVGVSACSTSSVGLTSVRTQGYSLPQDALAQVRPGQSKQLVMIVLGSPQTTSTFGNEEAYYYVETKVERTAFGLDMVKERKVLAVYFDRNDKVVDTALYGLEDGRAVTIEGRRTPSFGQDRTFVESIINSL